MEFAASILLIAVLVAAFFRFRSAPASHTFKLDSRDKTAQRFRRYSSQSVSPYRAVSIECGADACESVQQLHEKRFLSSEAPLLPLHDCACAGCSCTYVHHPDRRRLTRDRRTPRALSKDTSSMFDGEEKRHGNGRRRSDWRLV